MKFTGAVLLWCLVNISLREAKPSARRNQEIATSDLDPIPLQYVKGKYVGECPIQGKAMPLIISTTSCVTWVAQDGCGDEAGPCSPAQELLDASLLVPKGGNPVKEVYPDGSFVVGAPSEASILSNRNNKRARVVGVGAKRIGFSNFSPNFAEGEWSGVLGLGLQSTEESKGLVSEGIVSGFGISLGDKSAILDFNFNGRNKDDLITVPQYKKDLGKWNGLLLDIEVAPFNGNKFSKGSMLSPEATESLGFSGPIVPDLQSQYSILGKSEASRLVEVLLEDAPFAVETKSGLEHYTFNCDDYPVANKQTVRLLLRTLTLVIDPKNLYHRLEDEDGRCQFNFVGAKNLQHATIGNAWLQGLYLWFDAQNGDVSFATVNAPQPSEIKQPSPSASAFNMFPMEKALRTSTNPIRNRFNQVIDSEGTPIKDGAMVPFESNGWRIDSRIATSDVQESKKAQIKAQSVKKERNDVPAWRKIVANPSDDEEGSFSSSEVSSSSSSEGEDEGATPVNQIEVNAVATKPNPAWSDFVKKHGRSKKDQPFFGHEQASWEEDPADQTTNLHLTYNVINALIQPDVEPEGKKSDDQLNTDDKPLDKDFEEEATSKEASQSGDEWTQEHDGFFEVDLPAIDNVSEPTEDQVQAEEESPLEMELPVVKDDQLRVLVEPVKLPDRLINPEGHVVKKKWKFLKETEPLEAPPPVQEKGDVLEINHDEAVIPKSKKIKKQIKWRFLKQSDPLKKSKELFEEEIPSKSFTSTADPFIHKILRTLSTPPMSDDSATNASKESKKQKNIFNKEKLIDVDWNSIPPYRGPQDTIDRSTPVNVADFVDLKYDVLPEDYVDNNNGFEEVQAEDDLVTVDYESDSDADSLPGDNSSAVEPITTEIQLANNTSTPIFRENVKSDVPNENALFFDGDQQELPARRERPVKQEAEKPQPIASPSKTKEVASKLQSTLDKIKTNRSKKKKASPREATLTVTDSTITTTDVTNMAMGDKEVKRSSGRIGMGSPRPPSVVGRAPIMMHRRNPGPLSPGRLDAVRRSSNRKNTVTASTTATSASFTVTASTATLTSSSSTITSTSTAPATSTATATTTTTVVDEEDNGDGIFNGGGDVIIDDSGSSNNNTTSSTPTSTATSSTSTSTMTSDNTNSSSTASSSSSSATLTATSPSSDSSSSSSSTSAASTTTSSSVTATETSSSSTSTSVSSSSTATSSSSSSSSTSTTSSLSSSTASSTSTSASSTAASTSSSSTSSTSSSSASSSTASSSATSTSSSSSSSTSKTTSSESTKTESTKTESTMSSSTKTESSRNTGSSSFGQAQGSDSTKMATNAIQSYKMDADCDIVPVTVTSTDYQATSMAVVKEEEELTRPLETTETMQDRKEPTATEEVLEAAEIVTSRTLTEFIAEASEPRQSTSGEDKKKNKKTTGKKQTALKKKPAESLKKKTTKKKQTKKKPANPLNKNPETETRQPEDPVSPNNPSVATQETSVPRKIITTHPPKSLDDALTEVDVEELDEKVILWDLPPDLMDDLSKSYLIEEVPEIVWDVPFLAPPTAASLPPSKADFPHDDNVDHDDPDRSFIYQDGHWYEWDAKKKKK